MMPIAPLGVYGRTQGRRRSRRPRGRAAPYHLADGLGLWRLPRELSENDASLGERNATVCVSSPISTWLSDRHAQTLPKRSSPSMRKLPRRIRRLHRHVSILRAPAPPPGTPSRRPLSPPNRPCLPGESSASRRDQDGRLPNAGAAGRCQLGARFQPFRRPPLAIVRTRLGPRERSEVVTCLLGR